MSDPLASLKGFLYHKEGCASWPDHGEWRDSDREICNCGLSAVLASVPPPQEHPEESLALRILQEQKDLEAHALNVTDVDRLTQIRDSVLKEHTVAGAG